MNISIGELRHRITFTKSAIDYDDDGNRVEVDQTICTYWAKVNNLFGSEFWSASAVNSQDTVKFIIRYRNDIDTTMQIQFQGKSYEIIAIDNIEFKNQWLEIKAKVISDG